ncbi:hypothetical protein FNI14_04930 [Salmonella enterica subsp. salamae]|uniref:Uncharacterized protein n=1 Tax=Salmonella enterica subsp. salamae TaxID=59202 RepID=A0A5Y1WBL3_SALER|nr:hypothetical protein [Salmonella enterica]EAY7465212.1 hypothetical protein [Salmonella enterica]ECC1605321.1 hypothetical protein [Salmonella enterica subsp. salamae]
MSAEIKPAQDYRAVLMAGGMSKECADRLVAYLDDEKPVESDIERILIDDLRVQMAETLSLSWIIRELRRISTGEDKQAAVAALQMLFDLNRYLRYPTPDFGVESRQ